MIDLKHVDFNYNPSSHLADGFALVGVNLTAKPGLITVVRGESGSGKSTILHIISLLAKPLVGEVLYDEISFNNKSDSVKAAFRLANVGFIFQNFALIKEFSALENCAMPLMLNGMPRKQALAIALLQLKDLVGDHDFSLSPTTFSGGQQQRIAVIRATIHKPRYLIADEPTGSLDQRNAALIKARLRAYANAGNTVIVVSHDEEYCAQADCIFQLVPTKLGGFTLSKTKG